MKITISKSQWEEMGKKAGWMKKEASFGVGMFFTVLLQKMESWYQNDSDPVWGSYNKYSRGDSKTQQSFVQRLAKEFPNMTEEDAKKAVSAWANQEENKAQQV